MNDLAPHLDPDAVANFSDKMTALAESLNEGARRMGESLRRGIDQSVAGMTVDLGDFTQYIDDDDVHIDDSDICEDCGNRHGLFCPEMVTKTDDGHTCRGCDDAWTRTRAADSINTVRWSGWFA